MAKIAKVEHLRWKVDHIDIIIEIQIDKYIYGLRRAIKSIFIVWMDERKSRFKDCLQQSIIILLEKGAWWKDIFWPADLFWSRSWPTHVKGWQPLPY